MLLVIRYRLSVGLSSIKDQVSSISVLAENIQRSTSNAQRPMNNSYQEESRFTHSRRNVVQRYPCIVSFSLGYFATRFPVTSTKQSKIL
jgi:hypothetical protein